MGQIVTFLSFVSHQITLAPLNIGCGWVQWFDWMDCFDLPDIFGWFDWLV